MSSNLIETIFFIIFRVDDIRRKSKKIIESVRFDFYRFNVGRERGERLGRKFL